MLIAVDLEYKYHKGIIMTLEGTIGLSYVIFDVSELSKINFSQVLQTSAETCRLSVDKSKTLVKWFSEYGVPSCVESLTTKSPYYTHEEMLLIMATPEWTEPIEMRI